MTAAADPPEDLPADDAVSTVGEDPADAVLVSRPDPVPGSPEAESESDSESVSSPAKVMRIGTMTKELLEEVRRAPLDEASRSRLRDIYETSVRELAEVISEPLRAELARLSSPFDSPTPSAAELRVAQAQLVGWLEGLFHGIQASMFSQQMAARAQLEEMRRSLPSGEAARGDGGARPGTYL